MITSQKFWAYSVHLFTALGILATFASLMSVIEGDYRMAFIYNGVAILIDSVDGLLARKAQVKKYGAAIDGALMDNLIDFVTYTVMPAVFLAMTPLLPEPIKMVTIAALLLSSTFQFANVHAKTEDHFFLGFPSYWNLAVFYLWIWNLAPISNAMIVWGLSILSFVPIKFIYPSRIDFLSKKYWVRASFTILTSIWGLATIAMLLIYPNIPQLLHIYTFIYIATYGYFSVMKTFEKLMN